MDFEINLIILTKSFFLRDQKISWQRKELLRWSKKTFFFIFKGLSLKQLEGESPTLKEERILCHERKMKKENHVEIYVNKNKF